MFTSPHSAVSIQPKPKTGLEDGSFQAASNDGTFQSSRSRRRVQKNITKKAILTQFQFQSSRSRRRVQKILVSHACQCCNRVSIQPKPKTGLEGVPKFRRPSPFSVSIQPKPKTGLEEVIQWCMVQDLRVSIQPKPKTGLEAVLQYVMGL